ncbi:MAG: glycoside hydrolase family 2 protein [Thermoleophilaceae bacterium]
MHLLRLPIVMALAGAVLLTALAGPAGAQVSTPSKRVLYADGHGGRYLMDGTWLFRTDAEDRGVGRGFQRQTSAEGWNRITVPNASNAEDNSPESQRGTVNWYRKDFRPPSGRNFVFRFEAVNFRARVYLNGREIGRHEGDDIPFEIPASKMKRGTNRLVVRVDNRRQAADFPGARDQASGAPGGGWWNYNGILREVYLRRVGAVDIVDFGVRPILPCRRCAATAVVTATLRSGGGGRKTARLNATVAGRRVPFREVGIPARGTRQVSARVRIPNPRLWEPGSPELYRARASVQGSSFRTHFGIRSFSVNREGRMLLNGRPVALRGASIHEEAPGVGAALGPAQRAQLFNSLRDLGATVTRAHYPLHPSFYEMADRSGILIYDQIPFYQVGDQFIKLKSVREKGLRYLEDTIRRDQNHPSVFVWSVANELGARPTDNQNAYVAAADRLANRLDPSRLTSIDFAGYPGLPRPGIYRRLDILGVNSYFGWYPGPGGSVADRSNLGPFFDSLHKSYPRQSLFVTEFGAESNRSGPVDEKGTFEFQNDFMDFHVRAYDEKPYIGGAIAWILRDFKVRPEWDGGNPQPNPPFNNKGLIEENGTRKPAFGVTQRLYRQTEPLR